MHVRAVREMCHLRANQFLFTKTNVHSFSTFYLQKEILFVITIYKIKKIENHFILVVRSVRTVGAVGELAIEMDFVKWWNVRCDGMRSTRVGGGVSMVSFDFMRGMSS